MTANRNPSVSGAVKAALDVIIWSLQRAAVKNRRDSLTTLGIARYGTVISGGGIA
jgi:hypothetical protein